MSDDSEELFKRTVARMLKTPPKPHTAKAAKAKPKAKSATAKIRKPKRKTSKR